MHASFITSILYFKSSYCCQNCIHAKRHGAACANLDLSYSYVKPRREKVAGLETPQLPVLVDTTRCSAEAHYLLVHQKLSPQEWGHVDGAKAGVKEMEQLDSITACDYKASLKLQIRCPKGKVMQQDNVPLRVSVPTLPY